MFKDSHLELSKTHEVIITVNTVGDKNSVFLVHDSATHYRGRNQRPCHRPKGA